jgi:adenosylmethionine-8-amino-7-oxononanoate aminotransferase
MTTSLPNPPAGRQPGEDALRLAEQHLWGHFTPLSAWRDQRPPVIVSGEGAWVRDHRGRRYLDAFSAQFVAQLGHGRGDLADAAARQARQLAFYPVWSFAHEPAVHLAARLAELAPGDLNRVFFTTGGSEAVESAWKLAVQYHRATGQPGRRKVLSRHLAYHGTTLGALSLTGVPAYRTPFEPLVPGAVKVANTNAYRCGACHGHCSLACAADIETRILMEGPETVAAVILEPLQNAGGAFPPPPGYWEEVRAVCDRYGVLLISDEVICAFGRLGTMFGAEKYGYRPDMITFAKGVTSGYAPLGGVLISDRVAEPFQDGPTFLHGITFAGHPVSCAVALANLDAFDAEDVLGRLPDRTRLLHEALTRLADLPIVGDVRGDGMFRAVELVKDKDTKESFTDAEAAWLLRDHLSEELITHGVLCRTDDRGDPVIILAPPLISGPAEIEHLHTVLEKVLTGAWKKIHP